jgi:U3 small nucleolar RNA-associated protein 25
MCPVCSRSPRFEPCLKVSNSPWTWNKSLCRHVLHFSRKRRRIIKNNERLSAHAKANPSAPPLEDPQLQDQGFTRPSILVLLPFRNSALAWVDSLTSALPADFQIENRSRFEREFGLPEGAVDKLRSAAPGTYPADHVDTFSGNVDDNFRIGVKLNRKSVKLFSDFYSCDIVLASPLGLRMSIEKDTCVDADCNV